MTTVLDRSLRLLEMLARAPEGLPLAALADRLEMPRSAAHRLLGELVRQGYVRQGRDGGPYALTLKLVGLGLTFLAESGIPDIAQPVLDRLAAASGELVRLGVIRDGRLVWVAKAQGARAGLRYDPDNGAEAHLASTANGQAWLATLPEEAALALVAAQGFGEAARLGPQAPRSVQALLARLAVARAQGFATVSESSAPGTAAVAAVIRAAPAATAIGVLSIAGPSSRLDAARLQALAPALLVAAAELGQAGQASPLLRGVP
ncbi:IclR family transcriptional regulator [Falsiroseomonas selenitidurans]|uniref:IclR family transcriptional regulator n=1 Tax=Falsiroseomonas selenitidurans TaxID=2716335 RepID=A0ABX1E021_9PROT|nr:IclR family transcriptional regulator [Falsiroseomonas selenitidurans]NKC30499.1 IclR family transcriptional regulator [Falsiroseomonas selenitidurans]